MAKVRLHRANELDWNTVRELTRNDPIPGLAETDLNARITYHEPGNDRTIQLFEVCYEPGALVAVHSHDEDEIIYVVEGEMVLGAQTLQAGSSVFVAGGTYYGFTAGPSGLRFLNFRPRADSTYHPRQEPVRTSGT